MLVEKVSKMSDISKQTEIRRRNETMIELDGKFQQMEMFIVNLSKEIKDEQCSKLDWS